jgi:TatD DNase family protein
LGELGLDYLPRYAITKKKQLIYFQKQLHLNKTLKKPLVLHIVHAHSDALDILKSNQFEEGIIHSFSEGKEVLKEYLNLGFLISVGPAVMREGFRKLKEAVSYIPIDRLVLETDCPDSKSSEPGVLIDIARKVGELRKNENEFTLLSQSAKNLQNLLNQQKK